MMGNSSVGQLICLGIFKTNLLPLRDCIFWNLVTRARDELRNESHLGVLDLHVYADGLGSAARVNAAVVHDAVEAVGVDDGRR